MTLFNGLDRPPAFDRDEPADADLFEIATHLELEALALAWAIRNRQDHFERLSRTGPSPAAARSPFGLPDPTRGATHFHRHDEAPPWAAGREPAALIGNYVFYDLRTGCNPGSGETPV